MDLTIGRKGFVNYLKALGGSNVVKVVPDVSASGSQANGNKRLKVVCGANTSLLADGEWISEKTPVTFCEVRVSPRNTVKPNIGAGELAEALNRVLPFTATDDTRPVLACVRFEAKDGKLTMVSADGFTLAVVSLDYDEDGQALVSRDSLKGIANALRRAKRARITFEPNGSPDRSNLILDTELIRYKWTSIDGSFPNWPKLIPNEFATYAHFDATEAIRACGSLKVLSTNPKAYPIDLTIGNGKVVMASPDDKGQAEIAADTEGEGFIRVEGKYLSEALKACGGMVELKFASPVSPMLFTANGFQVVVMPMFTEKSKQAEAEATAKAESTEAETAQAVAEAEAIAKGKAEAKPKPVVSLPKPADKPKRKHKAKEPVAVA